MTLIEKILKESLYEGMILYHGGDINNIKALFQKFEILSVSDKLKFASSGGGNYGLSTSKNKRKALKYSHAFGYNKVLVIQLLKNAKILKIKKEIDSLTQVELEELSKRYDAVEEQLSNAEDEVRILKSNNIIVLGIEQ